MEANQAFRRPWDSEERYVPPRDSDEEEQEDALSFGASPVRHADVENHGQEEPRRSGLVPFSNNPEPVRVTSRPRTFAIVPPAAHAHPDSQAVPSTSMTSSSEEGSDSSLVKSSSSTSSDSMRSALARSMSSRRSSQSFGPRGGAGGHEENLNVAAVVLAQTLEASMSRKQGWLPFPPARPAQSNEDSNSSDFNNFKSSWSPRNNNSEAEAQGGAGTGEPIDGRGGPKLESTPSTAGTSEHGTGLDYMTSRTRTYEIKVKQLYYKLPPPKVTLRERLVRTFAGPPKHAVNGSDSDDRNMDDFDDRCILRNINFEARPGEVLAIAGASGAGKSTILECLAGRVKPSSPPGCILVNNQIMSSAIFRRISGYVMQDDALFPTLTVLETLLISARLRLPATMSRREKLLRVQNLMTELGLQHAADTRIGNEMIRGVSGGERRRVSIGIDVIHDPAVLILDEPTSGLDSGAALNVIAMLRAMARSRGRTVILSIHQPSFRILQLMHSILLVAGGMVVHHGSVELLASRLANYGHQVPARTTVLEYAIDAINSWVNEDLLGCNYAAIARGLEKQQQVFSQLERDFHHPNATVTGSVDLEKGLIAPQDNRQAVDVFDVNGEGRGGGGGGYDHNDDHGKIAYANNILQETVVLTERFFKNILRTKELFGARSIQALFAGIILGTVFLNMDDDRQGVADRLGFFVFTLSFLLNSTTEALPIFLQERQILMRETSRGAYRIISYVLSQAVVFVPFLFAIAILYAGPSYWLAGLDPSVNCFLFYCLVMWFTLLLANSFVACFSALVPNYIMGQALVAAFMGAFFLFSGYIINRHSIPKYWIWMHYISLFKYPFDAILLNEFGGHRTKCYDSAPNPLGSGTICTLTGSQVLNNAGVQGHRKWIDVGAMLTFILFYRISCYFAVRWRLSKRTR